MLRRMELLSGRGGGDFLSDSLQTDISWSQVAQDAKLPLSNVDVGEAKFAGGHVLFSGSLEFNINAQFGVHQK